MLEHVDISKNEKFKICFKSKRSKAQGIDLSARRCASRVSRDDDRSRADRVGCHKKTKPRVAARASHRIDRNGMASWYGYPYHGRRAANGEIYDMEKLTAAHRTLPFDTWVEVRNLANEKTVTVRITDRGPFVDGRIIDVSKAAARAIDLIGPGVARVRLTIVAPPPPAEIPW